MRRLAVLVVPLLALCAFSAGASASPRSWASPHIAAVVNAGLMGPSVGEFRAQEPLTASELAVALASLGSSMAVTSPDRPVTVRELNARLVSTLGLRPEARAIRQAALGAGLRPTSWLGTETVARLLGLRVNHPRESEHLELQLSEPATRAEAAYSIARTLALRPGDVESVRRAAATFAVPTLDEPRRALLTRALRLVGSPYVWGGTSERPQQVGGRDVPGGFDCSGLVWRVYKIPPLPSLPGVADTLRGRTSYAMSGEVDRAARVPRDALEPGDLVFFGPRGPRSKPSVVGHMGVYVGNGWIVHSSTNGTTLQPMTGWYERTFAWGRNVLAEAGIASGRRAPMPAGGASTVG